MRRRLLAAVATLLALAGLAWSRLAARDMPFSPLSADGHVGGDYAERRGIAGDSVSGEVDDMAVFDRPGFDADTLHPEIRRFYEETTDYEMVCAVRWHRGFRLGAALAAPVTSHIEQLNLPGPGGDPFELESRIVTLPADTDPREGARLWIRTRPDRRGQHTENAAVFVAAYARHERGNETYTNIAVPLPGGNLSTVLRPEVLPTDAGTGVVFTTEAPGDPGLYLVTPLGSFRLPMGQRFRVYPADASEAPAPPDTPWNPDIVATHEMWLCGAGFLTITYAIRCSEKA
ncbi:hypothetical protein HWV23_10990 [Natronomonas halophila]|uniref:hypothetical protein n=1 Tax=Natronomonas halophila TaxID=2747817 RepID=UPI0015B5D0A7|nr:hypothetical protein [Natronomonas halophila]QLD86224.1 hypothetical protein HWV23_10990 [Natronomonas halophila]